MKHICIIVNSKALLLMNSLQLSAQTGDRQCSLSYTVDTLSFLSNAARTEKLRYANELLRYENYKKSFLPSFLLTLSPVSFNRSLRLLQQASDGNYSYVEDYANTGSVGMNIRQKIGIFGGELSIGSNLSYLHEYSQFRQSFSTSPYYISYSQQLWGGRKLHRLEKSIEETKNLVAVNEYCANIARIQQQVLGMYLEALSSKMNRDLSVQTRLNNDTLLHIAKVKLDNGHSTEYEYKQIEVQCLKSQLVAENATKSYEQSLRRLSTFLGRDRLIEVSVPDFDLPLTIDSVWVELHVRSNHPFYRQLDIQRLEAERELYSVRISNGFNVNISLGYGVNQYAENLSDAYRRLNARQSVGVMVQIPVFQWGIGKNKVRMAENTYHSLLLERESKRKEFENQLIEKIDSYHSSLKQWLMAKRTYQLSLEQYRMVIKLFSLGKTSGYELYAAQNNQFSALTQYYSAIRQAYTNYYAIRTLALYDFKVGKELIQQFINRQSNL